MPFNDSLEATLDALELLVHPYDIQSAGSHLT